MIQITSMKLGMEITRPQSVLPDVAAPVAAIIAAVRQEGDAALLRYTEQFDGVRLSQIAVPETEIDVAYRSMPADFIAALETAAANIRAFHEQQKTTGFVLAEQPGVCLGQRVFPLERVGVYVPGGTAAYPSTVLMDVIPAKIAGVGEVIMVTPPDHSGAIAPAVLAAARVAGVTGVLRIGGAQAVAALAYGTESVPRVDKIVGPGNVFVAEAKRQVYGQVDIDMIAGPSEILIVADADNDPAQLAADLLSQAEHDKLAAATLITVSADLAAAVAQELERQIPLLERAEIARASIDHNGSIIVCETLQQAAAVANAFAPEHLELAVADPFALLPQIRNAGSIFLGRDCPEPLGDYWAGPNHTLPTNGTARFASPLGVYDFVKRSSFLYYSHDALAQVHRQIETLAQSEGLTAHARAVAIRFDSAKEEK